MFFKNFLLSFFKNNKTTEKNNNRLLTLTLSNILGIYEINKIINNIEYEMETEEILPKKRFYNRYHINDLYITNKESLNNLNFINKEPDITLSNIYNNRKIYYILNEFDNLIKLKIIDYILKTRFSMYYSKKLLIFLEILKKLEKNNIKNENKRIKDIEEKEIEAKFNKIKEDILFFEETLSKKIKNSITLSHQNEILKNIIKKYDQKEILESLKTNVNFKDHYSHFDIFEKLKEIDNILLYNLKKRKLKRKKVLNSNLY